MGVNNKQRRAFKKKKKLEKQKENQLKKNENKNPHPKMEALPNPFENISLEDRRKIIQEMITNFEKEYNDSLEKIFKIFSKYEPLTLLSMLSNYGLMVGVGDKGIDRDNREKELQQFHVEIAQSILLLMKEDYGVKLITPDVYQNFQDAIIDLARAFSFKRQKAELLDYKHKELSIEQVQEQIRIYTQTVRNWGHYSQVKKISRELYSKFDEEIYTEYSFSASSLIVFFDMLLKETEERANARYLLLKRLFKLDSVNKILIEYNNMLGNDEKNTESLLEFFQDKKLTKRDVQAWIISHYDLRISEVYIFNINELSEKIGMSENEIQSIVEEFSYQYGESIEYNIEHIYLNNPIWNKPIIKLDEENFYCALPQLFFSFILDSFNNLVKKLDKEVVSKQKSKYLENKIEEIVKRKFPEVNTLHSLKWKDGSIEYETDLITAIDSVLIIIEAKSGGVDASSLRGAPKRLERDIKKLLIEPNIQSQRLKKKLFKLKDNPSENSSLRDDLPIELEKINKIYRISVTLESFASLQSNVKKLEKTDWLPDDFEPCPTMNIADFETIFDILERPIEIINYLDKRVSVETSIEFMGDELDLLGHYLEHHLNFPHTEEKFNFILTTMSFPIDNYYDSKDSGIELTKPTVKMNKFFQSIINQLEQRKSPRWTEIGMILYSFLPEDQNMFASKLFEVKKNVKKNWMLDGHKNMLIYTPPLNTDYAMAYIVFNNQNKDRRREFAEEASMNAFENEHVKYCLVIGKNIDDENAYSMIALFEPSN